MTVKIKQFLAKKIQIKRRELCEWHLEWSRKAPPPFYCSVDLRDSGHKIVPVDSNLYPGGFNNICPEDLRTAAFIFKTHLDSIMIQKQLRQLKKILILPESHTHNSYYIENIYYLKNILEGAGFETQIGWHTTSGKLPEAPVLLQSFSSKELRAYPLQVMKGLAKAGDFVPDLILLNNDFSHGYPKILDAIEQPILPSHKLGWHSRKKSLHFTYYNQLAAEFADIIKIDPWIIQIDTEEVSPVHFGKEKGTEQVAQAVDRILERTRQAYELRQIHRKPFVFIKNNSGTYGIGIMVAHSSEDLRKMNRRTKNKMSIGKNQTPIESVVIQEGVPTATLVDRLAAEPVIYLVGCQLIGGFLRTNSQKSDEENLNSQGMVFKKLCMSDLRNPEVDSDLDEDLKEEPVLELVYGSIARISALATGLEFSQLNIDRASNEKRN